MPGLIGKKIGMTSIYDENGRNIACTLIEAGPCTVTQIKSPDKDGYDAVQIAYDERKEKNTSKPLKGHFDKVGSTPKRKLVEFQGYQQSFNPGDEIKIEDVFQEGEFVDIVGWSKGKGFQGVVKRHGFGGVGQSTHGQHNRQRHPGAIGACSYPAKVFKGLRMAGRTGNRRVKVDNLRIMKIYPEKNLILVSGSVAGAKNSYLYLEK